MRHKTDKIVDTDGAIVSKQTNYKRTEYKKLLSTEGAVRQASRRKLSDVQQIAKLDREGRTAIKERARLNKKIASKSGGQHASSN